VRDLQRRFSVDVEQARRVRSVALARYAEVAPHADDEARRELAWAGEPRTMYLLREEASAWTRSGALDLLLPDQERSGETLH